MTQDKEAGRRRTEAATRASSAAARQRRIAKLVKALEDEGFVVTLAPKG